MANILSSKKDAKRSSRQRLINQAMRNRVRTYKKNAEALFKVADATRESMLAAIREFESVAMRAANSRVVNKFAVRRKVSILTLKMKAKFGKLEA